MAQVAQYSGYSNTLERVEYTSLINYDIFEVNFLPCVASVPF